jgi:hypothetical protein
MASRRAQVSFVVRRRRSVRLEVPVESALIKLLSLLFGESVKRYPKLALSILALVIAGIIFMLWVNA